MWRKFIKVFKVWRKRDKDVAERVLSIFNGKKSVKNAGKSDTTNRRKPFYIDTLQVF